MKLKEYSDLNNPVPREVAQRALTAAQELYADPSLDAITWILRRAGKTTVQFTAHPIDNEAPA